MNLDLLILRGIIASTVCCLATVPLAAQEPSARIVPPPITPPSGPSSHEMTVTLKANEILQPGLLSSPLCRVRNDVVTDWGVNTFAIDSDKYGKFLVHSNTQLVERIVEIDAMKRIDDLKKTEEYGKAVKKAARREKEAENDAVVDYVSPIEKEPLTGIGKLFKRIGTDQEKDIDADDVRDYEEFKGQGAVAMARAKLDLCRNLGVNPYTTNLMLQRKLDDVSNAMAIGEFKMMPGPVSGDASLAAQIYRSQITPQMSALIYGKSRNSLLMLNQTALKQMGVADRDAVSLLANPSFTPWLLTQFITSLQALQGVKGRDILVRDATRAVTEESDAIFYADTARLLAQLAAQKWQFASVELKNNAPYCILRDGSVLLALSWDYACWSSSAEKCVDWLQSLQVDGKKPPTITLVITGQASARLRQEAEKRGLRLADRQIKGPLN